MRADAEGRPAGRLLLWALAVLVLVRAVSLAYYPLMDTTEARYADIARRMVERSDWITPWFTETQPFWGKPPLAFWLTAIGFKLFGVNEFAARLPQLLLGGLVGGLAWRHAAADTKRTAWHALALLAGSSLFLVSAGAVMTDMALTLGTTMVLTGFWRVLQDVHCAPARSGTGVLSASGWQIALGVTIGLLAKGPVSVVLWSVPIGVWVLSSGNLDAAWRAVPWGRVAFAALALSLPWYAWAELRTPGFLQYFIAGEHWQRFLTPGWRGDLYGSAHEFPRGSIWLFALGAVFPWPVLLPGMLLGAGGAGAIDRHPLADGGHRRFLWLWALTPCVFFTFAGNILWTYVLPGLPALAIFGAHWTSSREQTNRAERALAYGLVLSTVTVAAWLVAGQQGGRFERKSAKSIVAEYQRLHEPGQPLFFIGAVPFSGSFYSDGQARGLAQLDELEDRSTGDMAFVVMPSADTESIPMHLRGRLTVQAVKGGRALLRWQ